MKFTDIFIHRPVMAASLSVLLLLLGLNAMKDLQVRQYPEMTNTVITVSTPYPARMPSWWKVLLPSHLSRHFRKWITSIS